MYLSKTAGARIFQVEDLRGSRVIDRKAVREHPRPHAVPAPANKKAAECAPMGIKAAQRDSDTNKAKLVAKLVAERGAREEAERKLGVKKRSTNHPENL